MLTTLSPRKRIVAHQEAGHAVIGRYFGRNLTKVEIFGDGDMVGGQTTFQPWLPVSPFMLAKRSHRKLAENNLRNLMSVALAGPMAANLHQQEVRANGFSSKEDKRGYEKHWRLPVACCFPEWSKKDKNPGSAYNCSVRLAYDVAVTEIFNQQMRGFLSDKLKPGERRHFEVPKKDLKRVNETISAELFAAEEKAERILKKHWSAVNAVASALLASKKSSLSGKQLGKLLECVKGPHNDKLRLLLEEEGYDPRYQV